MLIIESFEEFDNNKLFDPGELIRDLVKLGFDSVTQIAVKKFLDYAAKDPDFKGWKLNFEIIESEFLFIIWDNPQDSKEWRESGYGEYIEDFSTVEPLPLLAFFTEIGDDSEKLLLRALTPEEKTAKILIDIDDDDDDEYTIEVNTYKEFKDHLLFSIWDME